MVWLRWVVANIVGGTVGYLAAIFIAGFLAGGNSVVVGAVDGAILGFAQWQILRDYVRGIPAWAWTLVNTLAFSVGLLIIQNMGLLMAQSAGVVTGWQNIAVERGQGIATLGLVANFPQTLWVPAIASLLAGAAVGLPQWVALRGYAEGAHLWMPASIVGALVGMFAGLGLGLLIVEGARNNAILLVLELSVSGPGVFMIASIFTGPALIRIVRSKKQGTSRAPR